MSTCMHVCESQPSLVNGPKDVWCPGTGQLWDTTWVLETKLILCKSSQGSYLPSLSSPKDMPLPLPKEQIIILLPVYWESEINTLLYRRVCRYFCKGKAVSILAVQSIYLPVFVTITQVWYWAQKRYRQMNVVMFKSNFIHKNKD